MKSRSLVLAVILSFSVLTSACNPNQAGGSGSLDAGFRTGAQGSSQIDKPNPVASATPGVPLPTLTPVANPSDQPLALIYKGPGSCSLDQGDAGESGYGCSEAAADAATLAGFKTQYVAPTDSPDFSKAKVWIQPGGVSNVAYYAMSSKLRAAIVSFVNSGGGYVGFCAGAYLATDWFYIINGSSDAYDYTPARSDLDYAYLQMDWLGQMRNVYFEGGPYFYNLGSDVEVTAKFSTGYVSAARSVYGKGRVYISGGHPEAPAVWGEEDGIRDQDGSDLDLAAAMIQWASGL